LKVYSIKFLGLFIFILFSFFGCKSVFHSKPSEGIIHYELQYLESEDENPIISLLPTEMDIEFKDNFSHQKVEGWMGIFYMGGIFNPKTKRTVKVKLIESEFAHKKVYLIDKLTQLSHIKSN